MNLRQNQLKDKQDFFSSQVHLHREVKEAGICSSWSQYIAKI